MNENLNEVLIEFADVAMAEISDFEGGADEKAETIGKLCAVIGAIAGGNSKIQDAEPDIDDDEKDENEPTETDDEEETEMLDGCGKGKKMGDSSLFNDELATLIQNAVDERIAHFVDSANAKNKQISDTYSEVSEAIGTNFDYSGMSRDELYKFGYETLSGKKLADDMDAVTAFKLVKASVNKSEKFADSQSTSEKSSTISEMLKQF